MKTRPLLPFFIGLRYILSRKDNRVISYTSLISMAGLTLGVLALIVVLSVFNGQQGVMRDRTLITVPHAEIRTSGSFPAWQEAAALLASQPGVRSLAPFTELEVLLSQHDFHQVTQIRGIIPQQEMQVSDIANTMVQGSLADLRPGGQGIILGRTLAANMRLLRGDSVTLIVPELRPGTNRFDLNTYNFTVQGIFDVQFNIGSELALIHMQDSLHLLGAEDPAEAVRLRLRAEDIFQAGALTSRSINQLAQAFPGPEYEGEDWSVSQASLFNALNMEKVMTRFMLLMIVAVGAFNIVSTLVMVVSEKQPDIAILRTMGAGKGSIMGIFIVQGFIIGVCGVLLGAALGILLTLNFDVLGRVLESLLIPDGLYMLSAIRTEILYSDVVATCAVALLISFLATLYPAWKASRIMPAEVLRYE